MSAGRSVALVGTAERPTAYAAVNRIWVDGLVRNGFDAHLVSSLGDLGGRWYDHVIHHDYQDHFAGLARPRGGRLIAVRTWDFGPYPRRWAEVVRDVCDELWVHSRWTAEQAAAGGIDPAKVHVIPHGVDVDVLTSEGPRWSLAASADPGAATGFTFLFVGAAVARKGVDILLDAYGRAFDAGIAVTLVIKDHTADVFYEGVGLRERIEAFRRRAGAPRLVYVDAYLEAGELAALYRACDAAVFPYRAEGFAMPILEAMACGRPAIVPRFGPCLDFCDEESAFFVPARRIRLPVGRNLQFNTLGFREEVEEVDFCEIDPAALAAEMRRVVAMPRAGLERAGRAAAVRARAFTWEAAIARICERLHAA